MPSMPTYTREEIEQRARDLIRTRRRGADVSTRSDYDFMAKLLAALAWAMQMQGKVARQMLDPREAFGAYLSQLLFEAGLGPDITSTTATATKTRGKVILLSTLGSDTQAAGSMLVHADGTQYTIDANVTTPALANKVLRVGDRSGRRRLFQGHVGAGFVAAAAGEVYRFSVTGEFCALRDVDNGTALLRYLFDLYNELDDDPLIQDTFSQQLGAVASITAVKAGALGNKDAKDYLTLVSPSGSYLSTAYILELSGGTDPMLPSAMQGALREILGVRTPPGTLDSIRQAALSYPGAPLRECYVVPATRGIGTYTLLPIHDDGQYVGAGVLSEIVAYASARVSPADKVYGSSVYEQTDTAITYLDVVCSEIYAPDWALPDGTVVGLSVTVAGSNTLTLSAAPPLSLGDRVLVCNAGPSGPYIVQRRVNFITGLTIGFDEPLPYPPDLSTYAAFGDVTVTYSTTVPFYAGMTVLVAGHPFRVTVVVDLGSHQAQLLLQSAGTVRPSWAIASGSVTVQIPALSSSLYTATAATSGISVAVLGVASYVTPGGPLGDVLIDAIHAAYEARAPSVGNVGPQVRLPISIVSDDPESIVAAVSLVEGVVDAECRKGTAPSLALPGGVLLPGFPIRMYREV